VRAVDTGHRICRNILADCADFQFRSRWWRHNFDIRIRFRFRFRIILNLSVPKIPIVPVSLSPECVSPLPFSCSNTSSLQRGSACILVEMSGQRACKRLLTNVAPLSHFRNDLVYIVGRVIEYAIYVVVVCYSIVLLPYRFFT